MNRRPSQSRTGFDSFSPQHTAHFKAAQPGGEFFEPKPRASLGRRVAVAGLCVGMAALGGWALVLAALAVLWRYHAVSRKQFGGITGDLAGWFLQKAELWMLAALCACQWGGLL